MITTPRRPRAVAALGLAAVLTFAACGGGGGDEEKADDTTTTAADDTTTTEATTTTAESTTTEAPSTSEDTTTTAGSGGDLLPFSFTDDFTTDTGWLIGCNEGSGCALVQDGRLAEALNPGSKEVDQHEQFSTQILTNLTISVTLLDFSGEPEAGTVCHYDPETDSYYDFTIRGDGTGSVYKFENGEGTPLADRFDVPIFTGGNEFITATCNVEADGSVHLTMEANFNQVVDVTDSTNPLAPGQIGLITYNDTEQDATVSFDDLSMEGQIYVE